MISLQNFLYSAGDVIKIRHSIYTHYALVSDHIGDDGLPMVIDNSAARGTVTERTWTEATAGKIVSLSSMRSEFSACDALSRARSFIGQTHYSLVGYNCETFVRSVLGLKPTSKQVVTAAVTVPAAMYLTHKHCGGNKWLTAGVGLLALAVTTKAVAD